MKCYLISRGADGKLRLTCQAIVKGQLVETFPAGPFEVGNASTKESKAGMKALALAILTHYYGSDTGGQAEAQLKADAFLGAFLLTHSMLPGACYEISSEVIDRFVFLSQIPVAAR